MTSTEFLINYFFPNYSSYIISLIVCSLFSFIIFRKKIRSIIDPMLTAVIGWTFANTIAVFLIFCEVVSYQLSLYFFIATLIFAGTFYYIAPNKTKSFIKGEKVIEQEYNHFLFTILFTIYISSTLYSFSLNGIPILNESRFAINIDNSSGILGLLGRLKTACSTFCIMYTFFLMDNGKKYKGIVLFVIILLFSLLSGSKGFVLQFCHTYFFYKVLYEGKNPKIKRKYIGVILATPILVISIAGYADSGVDSVIFYAYRVLAYGDIYWEALPNDVINEVTFDNPLLNMTYMLWGPFKHIVGINVPDSLMTTGGTLIYEKVNFYLPENGAPNSPLAIMSWIYYKWNGLFLVLIIAIAAARLYKNQGMHKRRLSICCIRAGLISSCITFSDIYLMFNNLFNLFLFCFMCKISFVLYKLMYNEKQKRIGHNSCIQ